MQVGIRGCKKRIAGFIKGVKLFPEYQVLYNLEKKKRSVFNLRFFNIAALAAVILFSFVDDHPGIENTEYRHIIVFRIVFALTYIIPFIIASFSIKSIKNPSLILALNALGFITFFTIQSHLSNNPVPLFHNTIALFLLNICLYLILAIQFRYSIFLSSIILVIINLNFHHMTYSSDTAITLSDLNFWFVVITVIVALVAKNIEHLLKKTYQVNIDLKMTNQAKYKLFSMVSHDLKNMISAQYAITDCLKDDHFKLNEAHRNRMIEILHQSSADVLNLFEDLMDWIKTQIETLHPNIKTINVDEFNKLVLSQMALSAERKNIKLVCNSDSTIPFNTDPNMLGMILRNLIGNAIKYSIPESSIILKTSNQNGDLEYQIIDAGIGMTDQQIKQLFNFEKIQSMSGTSGEKGTGLGLMLTKELVRILNGTLHIESTPQIGTTVRFKLTKLKDPSQKNQKEKTAYFQSQITN